MIPSGKVLVAGIGSSHGDDQAGWLVAESLAEQLRSNPDVIVRRAMIPLDVLDWLDGVSILHICDACETTKSQVSLQRFTWISPRGALPTRLTECDILDPEPNRPADSDVNESLSLLRGRGSHDFGIADVLRLAEKTGMLPQQVIIWAIAGKCFHPEDVMSDETRETVRQATNAVMKELSMFLCDGDAELCRDRLSHVEQ